jgi:ABC-type multidrug transport system ATPase subunit
LGGVKIGEKNQSGRRPELPREFTSLDGSFFSVGLDEDYYKEAYGTGVGDAIFKALRDMAFDTSIYDEYRDQKVAKTSLFRTIDEERIKNKFNRLAQGNAELTAYSFKYIFKRDGKHVKETSMDFDVKPESVPPTNIHTLIGRNGVGKTTCLNNLASAFLDRAVFEPDEVPDDTTSKLVVDSSGGSGSFANLISVTFSAFDPFFPENNSNAWRYAYIGLKEALNKEERKKLSDSDIKFRIKAPDDLLEDFLESAKKCTEGRRLERWSTALRKLSSDPIFEESEIVELADFYFDEDDWEEDARRVFRKLSSGHKIVLLTITRLVELVQEQSLVLLDEPESHLHPPLLSAFVRALSELLGSQNGVAIIATHSPVVLQETPRSCAWILDRSGSRVQLRRPTLETFGENVGKLTHEVFGLEVTDTGFYEMIRQTAASSASYEDVIKKFDGELGAEAKSIIRALLSTSRAKVRP